MKYLKQIIILLFIPIFSWAQTNIKRQNQKATKPEIDKLYEKHKDKKSIILYTPYGNIIADVQINFNNDGKPESIIITGLTKNLEAVAHFISNLIANKLTQGYESPDGIFYSSEWQKDAFMTGYGDAYLSKGKMYFKAKLELAEKDKLEAWSPENNNYYFELESGDQSRFGGKKATKFEF